MEDIQQLREVASALGIKVDNRMTEASLKSKIAAQQSHRVEEVLQHRAEISLDTAPLNTEEEVRSAIARYTAGKEDDFKVRFNPDDTWYFHYKGAEDSGHMSMPLRAIQMKAETVSKGRRAPRSLGKDGTYGNSYADNILA
jgi:hypothetical protein